MGHGGHGFGKVLNNQRVYHWYIMHPDLPIIYYLSHSKPLENMITSHCLPLSPSNTQELLVKYKYNPSLYSTIFKQWFTIIHDCEIQLYPNQVLFLLTVENRHDISIGPYTVLFHDQTLSPMLTSITGWWFGTFFIFPYIGNSNPNWLIFFQRGGPTTHQINND